MITTWLANGLAGNGAQASPKERQAAAIVVATGAFAQELFPALVAARAFRPALRAAPALSLSPAGWARLDDASGAGQVNAVGDEVESILSAALQQAQTTPWHGETGLDFYVAAHLNDDDAWALLPQALAALRAAPLPFADHAITLLLALDSPALRHLPGEPTRRWRAGLRWLEQELKAGADPAEPPGRVAWVYLLDSHDTFGRPLHLPSEAALGGATVTFQAHLMVEFLAQLMAGLSQTADYRRQSLAAWQRDIARGGQTARIGAFAAASATLPVTTIARLAALHSAKRLLAIFDGPEQPIDQPLAQERRATWWAGAGLARPSLLARLAPADRDRVTGLNLAAPTEADLPDSLVVDTLASWEALLDGRWRAPGGPEQAMAGRVAAVTAEALASMAYDLDALLDHAANGAQVAAYLIEEVEEALAVEQGKAQVRPAPKSWLRRLLGGLRRASLDLNELPDTRAGLERLLYLLRRSLNRRAVWLRAGVAGTVLLAFAWAAAEWSSFLAGLRGLVAHRLGLPGPGAALATTLDLLALGLTCWLLALLAGAVEVAASEWHIHRAIECYIGQVRRRYALLEERLLRSAMAAVYDSLRRAVADWRARIARRRQTLAEAAERLNTELATVGEPGPLWTERLLPPRRSWRELAPAPDQADVARWAQNFLDDLARPGWEQESAAALAEGLERIAAQELAPTMAAIHLAAPGASWSVAELAAELRAATQVGLPLAREERAALVLSSGRQTPDSGGPFAAPLSQTTFLGLPPEAEGMAGAALGAGDTALFPTQEAGRLALVTIVQGAKLARLRLWTLLAPPAANGQDPASRGRRRERS